MTAPPSATIANRFRVRWWHFAIAVTLLVIATAWAWALYLRQRGFAHYDQVVAELRAAGQPTTVEDFFALAPPVDETLQEDWLTWETRFKATGASAIQIDEKAWAEWVAGVRSEPPAPIHAELAKCAALVADARALLRRGPPVLSAFGWAAKELPPGKRDLTHIAALHPADLQSLRYLAEWLHHHAAIAASPADDLADLALLRQALARPAEHIDSIAAVETERIRDLTYAESAIMGRLPITLREPWLSEPSRALALTADGWRGQRLLYSSWKANVPSPDLSRLFADPSFDQVRAEVAAWITGPYDCGEITKVWAHMEARMRGLRPDLPDITAIQPRLGTNGRLFISFIMGFASDQMVADARHRLYQLTVRVVELVRAGHELPADQTALGTLLDQIADEAPDAKSKPGDGETNRRLVERSESWFNPRGDHLRLRYERVSSTHFRLSVDPTPPVSNLLLPGGLVGPLSSWSSAPWTSTSLIINLELPPALRIQPASP